jgi:hypothetical protein
MVEYLSLSSVWNACAWKTFRDLKSCFLPPAFFLT